MDTPRYAEMSSLRYAIRQRRCVQFTHRKIRYTVEPHEILSAPKTGALVLIARIVGESESEESWAAFRYCEIRDLEIQLASFAPQRIPSLMLKQYRGPRSGALV